MKTQKIKITLITCLVLTLMLFSIFSFLICNNLKGFFNFVTNINLENNKISQANSSNNVLTDQNTNNNENTQADPQNENTKITNTSTCVSVGELWNDNAKQFKKNELLQLIKYATNINVPINDLSAIKNKKIDSGAMRGYNSSKDILVTLGGLQWTPTYLSYDKSGNPILTLWLANSNQLAGKSVYKASSPTVTPTKTTFDTYGLSTWNSGFSPTNSPNTSYPDAMYGTSYIRSVILNNGGWYSTATGGSSGITFAKKTDSIFSQFTVTTSNNLAIADYLVAPVNVEWQYFQCVGYYWSNNNETLSNEGYQKGQSDAGFFGGSTYNYSRKDKYDTWKDDLIWLPSLMEIGYEGRFSALWKISSSQYSNPSYYYWPRTSYETRADIAYVFAPSGSYTSDRGHVNKSWAVRPAIHLNLTKAVESAKDIWGNTSFNSDILNCVLKYFLGTNTTETNASFLSSISSNIGSGAINSNTIRTNANKVTDKGFLNSNGELTIKFGGLYWYATFLTKNNSGQIILTLFLVDSNQLYNRNKSSGALYNKYGSASWNGGASPYTDGTTTISNNYGNSNIRINYFSSASTTTNTASIFNPYLKTSSNYTAMGDFIVAPKDLNTQDAQNLQKTQSAKSTLGFRYNLPNESYASILNYSNPYKVLSLSASTTNYTAWQNDKLWLPSLSEVGLGSNNATTNPTRASGLWGLSTAQRSNTNKTATWLRSSHITDKNLAYTISADGLDYGYASIDMQNAIRPALHLNLTLACQYST